MSVVQKNSNSATASIDKVSRRVRANGDGSIFKDKKRNRWSASFYDFKYVTSNVGQSSRTYNLI